MKGSIWVINLILISFLFSLYSLFNMYYYHAYSLNSVFLIEFLDVGIKDCPEPWMANAKILLLALANIIAVYIFWTIRKLLKQIQKIGPFEDPLVSRMQSVLRWTIIFVILKMFASIFIEMLTGDLRIVINSSALVIIFLVGVVFVLVEVFKCGLEIRKDQKYTI